MVCLDEGGARSSPILSSVSTPKGAAAAAAKWRRSRPILYKSGLLTAQKPSLAHDNRS